MQWFKGKFGVGFGKIIGWIYWQSLCKKGVEMFSEVQYQWVDDVGLYILYKGEFCLLDVDYVVVCVGQEFLCILQLFLEVVGFKVYFIGGVDEVWELDVKWVISQVSWLVVVV